MSKPLQILIAEDNAMDAHLVIRALQQAGLEFEWERVDSEAEYLTRLRSDLDIILSDFEMPQFSGLRALELLKERGLDLPFIIISGTIGEERAAEVIKQGATDYLLKDRLSRLGPAVNRALKEGRMRRERRAAEAALSETEERFREVVQNIGEVFWMRSIDKNEVLFVSAAYETIWGRSCAELYASPHSWLEAVHPDDRTRVADASQTKLCDGTYHEEYRIIRPDGAIRWINDRAFPVRDGEGRVYRIAGVAKDITVRREAAEAIEERLRAEERLTLLAATAPGIIYAFRLRPDGTSHIPYASPKLAEVVGVNPEEVVDDAVPAFRQILPEDLGAVMAAIQESARTLQVWDQAFRVDHPTKGLIWIEGRSFPVREPDGGTLWHGFLLDITDRKKTESELILQAAALESAANGILITDRSGIIRRTNHALTKMTGYTAEELVGQNVRILKSGNHRPDFYREMWESILQGGVWRGELINQRKDGSRYIEEMTITPLRDDRGEVTHFIAIKEDITERKRSEERVHEQAAMLDLAHDAIIVRGFHDRQITFWNKGAERLYGWSSAEAIGRNIGDLIFADANRLSEVGKTLVKNGEWHGENRHIAKDGKKLIVSTRATLVRDEEGKPVSVFVIHTDITEQKELEGRFLRAQRMESIGTLASGVAHDLNNILAPIMMSVPILRRDLSPEMRNEIVTTVEMSAARGAEIVKQVLTFGRGLEGDRCPLQIGTVIKEVMKIMRETFPKDIVVDYSLPADLWLVVGDATQLHQIVLNLCVNARDAMPAGGRLSLSASNLELDESYASMLPGATPGPNVLLEVNDKGSGIPPEILERIFDPFFTTKGIGKGTGLGLSTVLGIVKSHGGHINVTSEIGAGTTFQIYLPAARDHEERSVATVEEPPVGNGELVLVIDDEEEIRRSTQFALEAHGYRTLLASDGLEGLSVYARNMGKTAIVLTDLMMPHMDGVALIHALRKMGPTIPIVASTGLAKKPQLAELKQLNVHRVLNKPYSTETLLKSIHEALQNPLANPSPADS